MYHSVDVIGILFEKEVKITLLRLNYKAEIEIGR